MPQRHVFICGLHRSGTTLLNQLLKSHPDMSGFTDTGAPEDEGQHLQSVYLPARAYGGPGKFAFSPEAHLTESSPLVNAVNRAKLATQWSKFWDMSKPLLVEKSPPNIIRSRFLQAMFPDSMFIFLVRHPIPVAFATLKWAKTSIPELVRHWGAAHGLMLEDMPHIKNKLQLRYEDWIADPAAATTSISRFLGISPLDAAAVPVNASHNAQYFEAWEELQKTDPKTAGEASRHFEIARGFGYLPQPPYTR